MNKDEALKCLDISKQKYQQGQTEAALKFAKKSQLLHSTPEAQQWVI
jgi:hypothetical protein